MEAGDEHAQQDSHDEAEHRQRDRGLHAQRDGPILANRIAAPCRDSVTNNEMALAVHSGLYRHNIVTFAALQTSRTNFVGPQVQDGWRLTSIVR